MDIGKLLKNVHSINEYISITQDASEKCKNSKIQLNMSTVLALKKVRSLEIEYFNKCEENGIACIIFERMLCLPPSKSWAVLSNELVNLLQYWLDAIRKHLCRHNLQWWSFMKLLLRFIKEIRYKHTSLPNILVEHTAECLLDLATNSHPDVYQRYEILHCFNMYCSESNREIRFALRNRFGQYFTKLSACMARCGHLPTQYSIMETLLRWLLPRQDRTLRITSAAKWFPSALYKDQDVDIFLERSWANFFQDARDFLNAHNQRQDLITSVVCRKLTVGKVVIISGNDRSDSWLDINCGSGCVSALLDPRLLHAFGSSNQKSFEALIVTEQNTHSAKLHKESVELLLSFHTVMPPPVLPSCLSLGDDVGCDVTAVVTTRCDVRRLDHALRRIFVDKYQLLLDLDKELEQSPPRVAENTNQSKEVDEDPRFSHPVEVKRRKHSGYIVKPRQVSACLSPSTASTSSLAQLHEKLAALPRYKYDKEPVSVCALPELSIVTEVTEVDQSLNSTLKFKPYGVCYKNFNTLENRKSQSDPETSRKTYKNRRLSPVVHEDTTSCLLVATIGSTDDSVINDTVERLSKSKDYNADNIVDLLVQEALQAKCEEKEKSDSGINTGDKKSQELNENSETIDNTPEVDRVKLNKLQKKVTKVVSSTSDESNTEAIIEAPCFVSTRRKNRKEVKDCTRNSFDEQEVEEFFSQHITEKNTDIIISPTLARKINETSSETSDNFGDNLNLDDEDLEEDIVPYDFNNIEVIECLNSMVDKVCDEFDKCTKYLNKDDEITVADDSEEENVPLKDIIHTIQDIESKNKKAKPKAKRQIKLKYKITPKKAKARATKRKNKLELEPISKMSTIIEDSGIENADEIETVINPTETEKVEENVQGKKGSLPNNEETPKIIRRKRKLYSPKDEQLEVEPTHAHEDDIPLSELKAKKTPKSTATCYKEIEKDRQKHIRIPRTRKSKTAEPPSPRTKKMNDMFDKVKESANGEKVKLADKTFEIDVYNFTSDSDDDFKVKKIEISKRNSTTTVASIESAVSKRGRNVKRINYTDNKSSDESNKNKRKVTRKPRTKKKVLERNDLVDERMREAKNVLDTSIIVEKATNRVNIVNEPDLILEIPPEMEVIEEKSIVKQEMNQKKGRKKPKLEHSESKRPKRVLNKAEVAIVKNFNEDRTESPLPGLLVEPEIPNKEDSNELSKMADKFKKIYREVPETYVNDTNTTQNLMSDVERINYSSQNDMNEELIEMDDEMSRETKVKSKEKSIKKKKSNSIIIENIKKEKTVQKKKVKGSIEVINISEATEVKSEKSIATIGITGHGDLEEAPPSPQLINERLAPRNLEVDDLDHSMKDYFEKLTKEMNESDHRDSSNDDIKAKAKIMDSLKSNSPVVSIERLSLEDVSRWLPSRRNSDTDQSYVSIKSTKQNSKEKTVELVESPKISKIKRVNTDNSDETRRSLRLIFKNSQSNNIQNSGQSKDDSRSIGSIKQRRTIKMTPEISTPKKKSETISAPVKKSKTKYASAISPIKLFDDLISIAEKQSECTLSDDEEYMRIKKNTNSKKNLENSSKISQKEPIAHIKNLENPETNSMASVSSNSKMSTSTRIEHSGMTKRRLEGEREISKRRKIEVNNNVECISSGATLSSVDDWFKRMEPEGSPADAIQATMKHSMQGVLERLDTTLVEINRNTSKKFVHLFVDAQKHLSEVKEQRQGMYRQVASDVLKEVVKIIDDKFADLDKRSQELDNDFMKKLKERASELIREDCTQKRAMVRLLREDVQAVLDHIDRQGTK